MVDVSSSNMVLGLKHVSLVFVVLGTAMLLSFIMFLVELYKKYCTQTPIATDLDFTRKTVKPDMSKMQDKEPDLVQKEKVQKGNIFNFIWNI